MLTPVFNPPGQPTHKYSPGISYATHNAGDALLLPGFSLLALLRARGRRSSGGCDSSGSAHSGARFGLRVLLGRGTRLRLLLVRVLRRGPVEEAHHNARDTTGSDHEEEAGNAVDDVEDVHHRERVVLQHKFPEKHMSTK